MSTKGKISKHRTNNLIEHHDSDSSDRVYFGQWRLIPMTKMGIKQLINDMYHWAYNSKDAFHLSQFLRLKKVGRDTFDFWCKKFPELKAAYEDVKYIMAGCVYENAMVGKYSSSMAQYSLPKLHKEWDETARYHADLKKLEDKSSTNIEVIKVPVFVEKE